MSEGEYEEFNHLSEIGFHINSAVVIFGLLLSTFLFGHTLYEWKLKDCKNKTKSTTNSKKKSSPTIIYTSLTVLLLSIIFFIIYFMEFFWFRIFVPTTYNYNSYTFCNRFSPFLFASIFVLTLAIVYYFLIRLQTSFQGSTLAYPKFLYIILKLIAIFLIIGTFTFVIIATDGLPYSVIQSKVTNDNPWLCRNGIKSEWPIFWFILNAFGLFMMLGYNFLNWYLFMNRLSKLIELGLSHDDSFIAFYSSKHKRKQRKTIEMSYDSSIKSKSINTESINRKSYHEIDSNNIEMTPIDEREEIELTYVNSIIINGQQGINSNSDIDEIDRVTNTNAIRTSSNNISMVLDKFQQQRKRTEEEREERKKRRQRKERMLYTLIKRQSILTGIIGISGAIFWGFQITIDEGSTMMVCAVIISIICVYLSFSFKIKCFDCCCGKFMDDCTCIEDRMERKLARKMGLKKESQLEIIDETNKEHIEHNNQTELR